MRVCLIFQKMNKKKILLNLIRWLSEIAPLFAIFYIKDCSKRLIDKKKLFKAIIQNDENVLKCHKTEVEDFKSKENVDERNLKECHEKEIERKKTIEEKAKASLLAITLAITLMLGIITFILKNPIEIGKSDLLHNSKFVLIFSCGVLYFLYAGWAALRSIRIDEFAEISLEDEIRIKQNQASRNKELVQCIELNRLVTRKRSNYLDSSYIGIRNGIICLSICFVILIANVQGISINVTKTAFQKWFFKNKQQINKTIETKEVNKNDSQPLKSKESLLK